MVFSNEGYVLRDPRILGHYDQTIRNLAGKKVVVYPETLEKVYDKENFFGYRIQVIPLNNPCVPIKIMTRFLRTKVQLAVD
ncbi:MAG: hypothetical protein Q8N21_01040 [bacterium]|nr:hypothetical protein [bacterium]